MVSRRAALAIVVGLILPGMVLAQAAPIRTPALPEPIKGTLVICGGGKLPDAIWARFHQLAGGPKARLVLIPTVNPAAEKIASEKILEPWKKFAVTSLVPFHTRSQQRADDADFVKPIADASGVWISGGDQALLAAAYCGTAVEAELKKLLARGGVIGGTSAGAAIMSRLMIARGNPTAQDHGLGLLPNVVIDQHFLKRDRLNRLVKVLAGHPGWAGLGIDEETAVVVQGRTMTVLGNSYAVTVLSASSKRQPGFQVLRSGEKADLLALGRAALARAQPPFPPEKPPTPVVSRGTLIIGGGGGMPAEIWQRFIEAAGGQEAAIVVIPTALGDPPPKVIVEARLLQKAGAKNLQVLHAPNRAEADSPPFLAALKEARGIWFTGGRQWRFVDSYLDTRAHQAFRDVLARGGVIGGSSAGASIQADYMVRGDPLGNLKIMAEGYERGLGFLQGTAIDQHFFKRKRTQDMTELMAVFPQLLGIGIDESTALVVRGEIMEVVGKSTVAVYNRRCDTPPREKDYQVLQPGQRYNLKNRVLMDVGDNHHESH